MKKIPTMEPRISLVTLGVKDLKKARKFYEKGLGWAVSPASQGDVVFFQLGGIALGLYPRKMLAADAKLAAKGSGFAGITLAHNVRRKEDVAALIALAKKAGGKIVKPAEDVFWGGHSGYFSDIDGHLWEVAWNPGFKINKRGDLILP